MSKVKDFIKENKWLLLIALVVIAASIGLYYYYSQQNKRDIPAPDLDVDYKEQNYGANEYHPVTVDYIDLLNEYYKFFMDLQISNPKEAYNYLSEESKKKYDYEKYEEYLKKTLTINSKTAEVTKYRVDKYDKSIVEIIDSEDTKYTLKEKAIWDFEITLNGKV